MTSREEERRWMGASAMHGTDADPDRWVVWGKGALPDGDYSAEPGDEIAHGIVRGADREWNDDDGWVLVITGDETSIDELVVGTGSAHGFAPYLADGRREEASDEPMRGVLRNDVAPRRKVDQPRPS